MQQIRLGVRLGLFQLSLGVLGVLTLGLLNRVLIQDIQIPAALAALMIGAQELMGFTRAWFGHRSDQIPANQLRRTPYILASSCTLALLFGVAGWLVLQLAGAMQVADSSSSAVWIALLVLVFVGIGTAVSAGGTAFSALVADLTTERERPKVLAVVWAMRLIGVLAGTVLVSQLFGSACLDGAGRAEVIDGMARLMVSAPWLLALLGVASVIGLERPRPVERETTPAAELTAKISLRQMLALLRSIPQASGFMAVMCLFTYSMFLNDAVLEPYGAAVFGMNVCMTTSLNAVLAFGFLFGLLLSGFQLVPRFGMLRTSQVGAAASAICLILMMISGSTLNQMLFQGSIGAFGLSLGVCIHACLNLMFSFVQPGLTAALLGIWGVGYAYSKGIATVSGGGLLTLLQSINGGDVLASYQGVFSFQVFCFLIAGLFMNRLNLESFKDRVKNSMDRFASMAID